MDIIRSLGKVILDVTLMLENVLSAIIFISLFGLIAKEYPLHKYERSLMQSFFEKWNPADKIVMQTTVKIIPIKIVLLKWTLYILPPANMKVSYFREANASNDFFL